MSSSNTGTSLTPGSDAFLDSLLSMVNQEDMIAILKAQSQMLDRFEKTNEMLSNFNRLSSKRYEKTFEQFKEHTETLLTMKKDLDSVFRRIRNLKKKLATDYPRAFVAALEDIVPPDLDEEEDEPQSRFPHSPSNQPPHQPPHQPLKHPAASPRQQELYQQPQHAQQSTQAQQHHPPQQHQKQQLPQKQLSMDKVGRPESKEQASNSKHGSDGDK
ncbi:kxDL motif-containing protein 1 [Strongylocentrotus purpuratus]|uniref:KxDL domain-containing protein n=1 Tax=Strongylocentrotus purpuratus TaxID=7668 RepID=A0A7M7HPX1_STRPU|nr:kxDL motif-containing protein 1 [Strongylocentrotus purpuratus]XP_011680708.1 kxDL motif-containing protein 1 [Strongylocentrotus purpuratus]|eukprot:XP_003724305.1 PREDICTED: kxDL motif-containing protein 1 [Strongylocentrotus purpuratus]